MSDQQLGRVVEKVARLERDRVTYRDAEVVAVNAVASTFTADVPGAGVLEGIVAPPQFLPAVGDIVRLSLTGASPTYQPHRIAEDAITERELDGSIVEAIDQAVTLSNGKNTSTYATTDPTSNGTAKGDTWWKRSGSVLVGAWEWDGATWQSRAFGDQVIANLTADKILTGTLGVGRVINVGDPTGDHVEINGSEGIVAYVDDPVDGTPNKVAIFGQTYGTFNPVTGETTSFVDELGNPSFNEGTFNKLSVGGTDIGSLLAGSGKGLQVWYANGKFQTGIALEYGVLEVYRNLARDRNYVVTASICLSSTENNGEAIVRVRMTDDGTRPTTSSPIVAERYFTLPVGGRWNDQEFSFVFQRDADDGLDVKFLITLARGTGQTVGTVSTAGNPPALRVDDRGPYTMPSGTAANNGSVGGTSTAPASRRVATVWGVWAQNFAGNGTVRTDTTDLVQGLDPSGVYGDGRSLLGFGDLSGLLTGATIQSVHLYLYAYKWQYGVGEAIIGTHNYTTAPTTFGAPFVARARFPWSTAEGKRVDLTPWAAEFQSGATKGVTFGPSNWGDYQYHGRFLGVSDQAHVDLRPRLEIVYYK